jgi:phage baseplate assembly protein W
MAYGLKKISVVDLKPSTGVGVSLPFSSTNVFQTVYTTKDQTKYNLINFLLTDPRERPFNPNFGAGLRARLFEQIDIDTFDDIQQSLKTQIENNFPNVQIVNLDVTGQPDYNIINIKFSYRLLRSNENDSVTLTIQNM